MYISKVHQTRPTLSSELFLLSLEWSENLSHIMHLVNYIKIYLEIRFSIFDGKQQREKSSLWKFIYKAQGVSLIRPTHQSRVIYLELCCHDPPIETSYTKTRGTKEYECLFKEDMPYILHRKNVIFLVIL
jgi:hypothetical protein